VSQSEKFSRALVGCTLIAAFVVRAAPLHAQTSAERAQARQLAAQGFEALNRKDFAEAEDRFRRADQLVHAPTLVLDRSRALVGLGRLVEAHEGFAQVLREGVAANAPWQWRNAVGFATSELAAVEPRLAWLTLIVHGPKSAQVQIDSRALPDAALGVPRATDPGTHTISVTAQRFLGLQKVVTLQEGKSLELKLSLEPDPYAPAEPAASKPAPRVIVVTAPPAAHTKDHTLATILLSVGGVGLVTGAITGSLALQVHSDLNRSCPNRNCVPTQEAEYADFSAQRDKYRALGTASGVAFAVGAGAALGGAALLLFSGKSSQTGTFSTPRWAIGAGPTSLSIACKF
jgi:hypothetical protein